MIKKLLLIFFTLSIIYSNNIFAQAPEGFNYQCVIRDNSGQAIANQAIGVQFNILQGSITGSSVYTESHTTTTNGYGLITLTIGAGTTTDDLSTVDWGNGPYYIHVEADANGGTNYSDVSTTQMMSVPYALYAKYGEDADTDVSNEIQDISLTGTDLSITSGSTIDLSSLQDGTGTDDQNITGSGLNGTTLTIGIENGTSEAVDLSSLQDGTGTDDQDLTGATLTGTTLQIDIESGTSATVDLVGLQDGVDDADNDPTNELNTGVTLNGTSLDVTDAGGTLSTDLSSLQDGTGTDDQDLTGATLTGTTLQIDIENGTSTTVDLVGLQDGVDDADNDPANEFNTGAILNGTDLEITDGGGTITTDLSSLTDDGDWVVGSGVVYNTTDNIGIGTASPTSGSLVVNGTGSNALYVSNLSSNRGAYIESLTGTGADIVSGSGDAVIGTTSSGVAITGFTNTGTAGSFTLSASGTSIISAFDGTTEVFTVDDGGNVGIGNTDPVHPLSIIKSNTSTTGDDGTFIDIWNSTSTGGVMSGIRFNNNLLNTSYSAAYKGGIFYKDNGSWGVGDLHFAINNTITSPNQYNPATIADTRMTIKSTGEVRIQGLAGTGNRMLIADTDGDLSTQTIPSDQTLSYNTGSNILSISGSNSSVDLSSLSSVETDPQVGTNTTNYIPKWNGSALSTGTIYDNGKIGIGSIPNAKLHVNASSTEDGFRVQINGSSKLYTTSNGGTGIGGLQTTPTNGLYVYGRTGLGTNTPAHQLDVLGNVRFLQNTGTYGIRFTCFSSNSHPVMMPETAWKGYIGTSDYPFQRMYIEDVYTDNLGVWLIYDTYDDLELVNNIKADTLWDPKLGHHVMKINASSMPAPLIVNEISEDGNPKQSISYKRMFGLLLGSIRQLDKETKQRDQRIVEREQLLVDALDIDLENSVIEKEISDQGIEKINQYRTEIKFSNEFMEKLNDNSEPFVQITPRSWYNKFIIEKVNNDGFVILIEFADGQSDFDFNWRAYCKVKEQIDLKSYQLDVFKKDKIKITNNHPVVQYNR
jgi:hypothetical protein